MRMIPGTTWWMWVPPEEMLREEQRQLSRLDDVAVPPVAHADCSRFAPYAALYGSAPAVTLHAMTAGPAPDPAPDPAPLAASPAATAAEGLRFAFGTLTVLRVHVG